MLTIDKSPHDDMARTIATNVRARRHQHKLTTKQLAERSGIGMRTLSRLEAGRELPSIATVVSLAAVLEVPAADLLTPTRLAA